MSKAQSYLFIFIIGCILSFFNSKIYAQEFKFQCLDSQFNQPIPFAKITVKTSFNHTKTKCNNEGVFLIENMEPPFQIVFEMLGYMPYTLEINDEFIKKFEIKMSPILHELQEVTIRESKQLPTISSYRTSMYELKRSNALQSMSAGSNTIEDLIKFIPNVQYSNDPILGGGVGLNGMGGANVKLLIDGMPINGRSNGNLNLDQFSLSNISSVQTYFGPQSIIFGSDAAGGVINLISFENKNKLTSHIKTYYESIGKYNVDMNFNISDIKKNNLNLHIGRYYFNGLSFDSTYERYKDMKPKEQFFAEGKFIKEFRNSKVWGRYALSNSYYKEFLYNPQEPIVNNYSKTAYAFDEIYFTDRNVSNIFILMNSKKWNYNILANYSIYNRYSKYYKLNFVDKNIEFNSGSLNTERFDVYENRLIVKDNWQQKINKLQFGINSVIEKGNGSKLLETKYQSEVAVFVMSLIKFGSWEFSQGLRLNYYNFINLSPANSIRQKFVPVPALQFSKYTSNKWHIEWGYTSGYRLSSLKEKYLNFVDVNHNIRGNEKLLPEITHSVNFGADKNFYFANNALKTNIIFNTAFNINKNKINLSLISDSIISSVGNTYTYVNIGYIKNQTSMLTISNHLTKWKTWSIDAVISFGGIYYFLYNNISNKLSFDNAIILSGMNNKTNIGFQGNFKRYSKQPVYVVNTFGIEYKELKSYILCDFGIYKYFFNKKFRIDFGAKNIFNITSVSYTGQSGPGGVVPHSSGINMLISPYRSYYISLHLGLSK